MQIAQDKRIVDRFLTYIVREDSQINFVTRNVHGHSLRPQPSHPKNVNCQVSILKINVSKNFDILM